MTAQTKSKLDTLISEGKVQHISGVIGCCRNYYVQFPNETQKYMYNPNKSISGKLSNKISNYLYTEANMQASSSNANPAPAAPIELVTGKRLTKKPNHLKQTMGKYITNL